MRDRELEAMPTNHLRAGLQLSVASVAWTVFASTAAVALGIRAGSLVLVAFGFTGLLDAVGSATLVLHFRRALRHEAFSDRREQLAFAWSRLA